MKLVIRRRTDDLAMDTRCSVAELLVLAVLFLGAVNFLNREIYCFFAAFAMLLFLKHRFALSKKVIAVFLFSFILLVFRRESQGTISTMVSTFIYPVCFVIGYCFTERRDGIFRKTAAFLTLAAVMAMGNLLHLLLNVLINLGSDDRNLTDFWTNTIRAATSQSALGVGAITVMIAALFTDTSKWKKILAIGVLLVAMWCNLFLAGRTLLVITAVCLVVTLVYRVHISRNGRIRVLVWFLIAVAAVLLVFYLDLFGLQKTIQGSNFYDRFFGYYSEDLADTGRWDRKRQYLQYILDYPFGGRKIHSLVGGYAHDLYLDTYDEAGILALVAILIVEIQSVRTMLLLLKQDQVSTTVKMFALCILAGYHLIFFVEPIIAGMEWLLANYLVLYGSMACILRECNNIKDDHN